MKKKFLLSASCILMISNFAFAQQFHFGLGVTPSLTWMKAGNDSLEGDGSRFGFNYGLITEFAITDNYSFATGLTIDRKGGKLRTINPAADSVFRLDYLITYVDIPVTLKMKTNQIGAMSYFGQFGLAPGLMIGAKGSESIGSVSLLDDKDVKKKINNFNLSLVIGLGLEYNLSENTNFLVAVVYKNGFTDVLNDTFEANVNSIGLNLGILF